MPIVQLERGGFTRQMTLQCSASLEAGIERVEDPLRRDRIERDCSISGRYPAVARHMIQPRAIGRRNLGLGIHGVASRSQPGSYMFSPVNCFHVSLCVASCFESLQI